MLKSKIMLSKWQNCVINMNNSMVWIFAPLFWQLCHLPNVNFNFDVTKVCFWVGGFLDWYSMNFNITYLDIVDSKTLALNNCYHLETKYNYLPIEDDINYLRMHLIPCSTWFKIILWKERFYFKNYKFLCKPRPWNKFSCLQIDILQ